MIPQVDEEGKSAGTKRRKLRVSEAQNAIKKLCDEFWLKECDGDGYTLGPR